MKTQTQKPKRLLLPLCVTACVLLVVFFFAVNTGGIHVSPAALLRGLFIAYDRDVAIILQLRFPRMFMAMVGGAMMSVAGVLMQAVMRNPLADPGIIGVSSGAAFAAVLVSSFLPSLALWTPLFSFAGGLLAFFLVYLLAQKGSASPIRLILTGIAIDAFFSGLYQAFSSKYSGAQSIISANISQKNWTDVKSICIYAAVEGALRDTDTLSYADRPVSALSGGQLQRVWLAMALAQQTGILLLDEVTTYLDIHYQLEIMHLIRKLNREKGPTVVTVLHDVNLALGFCDEILVMQNGSLLKSGPVRDTLTSDVLDTAFGVQTHILYEDGRPYCLFHRREEKAP